MIPWIEQEFKAMDLGERLDKRLGLVAERMWQSPQSPIAAASQGWKEAMGAYRFFEHEAVKAEEIFAVHQKQVLTRAKFSRLVLHIQDTTELDFTSKRSLKGTGPLSEQSRQGFFAHTEYLLQDDGLPLGLWHSHLYARDPAEHGSAQERKQLPIEEKESHRWLEAYLRACQLKELCPHLTVISMGDREADIYEIFDLHQQKKSRREPLAQWIIRSNQNRRLQSTEEIDDPEIRKIHDHIQQAPVLGKQTVCFRAKKQFKKVKGNRQMSWRTAREAELEIRTAQVELKPPFRPGRKLQPIKVWVVLAKEINPPANEDPILWILLTSLKVKTLKQALRVLQFYCLRWQIEVFHKILKSGCKVEKSQLKKANRLLPRIALQMIIAWRIHYLTVLGRTCPEIPCGAVFEPWEWKPVVVIFCGKGAEKNEPSLSQMIQYIGRLGGHLNRKSDGDPGPQTLWRGLQRVFDFSMLWQAWK